MPNQFVGASVQNVSLKKQSDVVIKEILSTQAMVTLPDGIEALEPGQVLITVDGGETFTVAADDAEPNGILCRALTVSEKAKVLLIGVVRKRYLSGFVDAHASHLFTNNIILK